MEEESEVGPTAMEYSGRESGGRRGRGTGGWGKRESGDGLLRKKEAARRAMSAWGKQRTKEKYNIFR